MKPHFTSLLLTLVASLGLGSSALAAESTPPNIVIIYADDLGYGDIGCYGATAVKTPNIDRLAAEGLRFTQGYAPSGTCTPSRYSLLTGEYPHRKKGTGVLPGDAAMIIEPGRQTLPSILKKAGYQTSVVGKWHLGLGREGQPLDWNKEIAATPLDIGFDSSFIMAATGDRVPCVYVRDRKVENLDPADPILVDYKAPISGEPTGKANPDLVTVMKPSLGHDMAIINGVSRIGYMKGGKSALWKDEDMADVFTREAVSSMEKAAKEPTKPFFLYFATHGIHVPRLPHPRFKAKTTMGPRGDAIVELDWCVGEIIAALDRLKLTEKTLVLFSSDNGPVVDDGYIDQSPELIGNHKPAGPLRGGKYNLTEGGTRVPFIVRWPSRVKPAVTQAMISQIDFCATFAALAGQPAPGSTAADSENHLPALLGDSPTGRSIVVSHNQPARLALREGDWKFIPTMPQPAGKKPEPKKEGEAKPATEPQKPANPAPAPPAGPFLYNLAEDIGETRNLAADYPEKVQAMRAKLQAIRGNPPADEPEKKKP